MFLELDADQPVQIAITYEHGTMVAVSTNSPFVDHFLHTVKVCSIDLHLDQLCSRFEDLFPHIAGAAARY